jgi:hypothetical protein
VAGARPRALRSAKRKRSRCSAQSTRHAANARPFRILPTVTAGAAGDRRTHGALPRRGYSTPTKGTRSKRDAPVGRGEEDELVEVEERHLLRKPSHATPTVDSRSLAHSRRSGTAVRMGCSTAMAHRCNRRFGPGGANALTFNEEGSGGFESRCAGADEACLRAESRAHACADAKAGKPRG